MTHITFRGIFYHYIHENLRLDRSIFSRWVNGECAKWLGYFIANNHTLGVVHAWFAAFLGPPWNSEMAHKYRGNLYLKISHVKKTMMSLSMAYPPYPAISRSRPINKESGHQRGYKLYEFRIWDICANTVIPTTSHLVHFLSHEIGGLTAYVGVTPASHTWVADDGFTSIMTEALVAYPTPKRSSAGRYPGRDDPSGSTLCMVRCVMPWTESPTSTCKRFGHPNL